MAPSNRERVGAALDLLQQALLPYVKREMQGVYGRQWLTEAAYSLNRDLGAAGATGEPHFDLSLLLQLMWNRWNEVFSTKLGRSERSIVSELRETRNRWAHQEPFSTDDAYRALDSVERLLTAIAAPEASEVQRAKFEVLRVRFEEQRRNVQRRAAATPISGQPMPGLTPWREIVTPHPDVAAGRYQQAEFAADLAQVHRGDAGPEYGNPRDFFARTFLTDGLRRMLVDALRRIDGVEGGDPVIKLQTNFGGGKTHSMLALYHLFSGVEPTSLPGIEPVLQEAGVPRPPQANRAVLVGTALSPATPRRKPDGTVVNTLWGEMAWQLLGAEGYALVAEADQARTNPGSDVLRELFRQAEPSLILIDEWVAYVRLLYGNDHLPGGSFDANLTFAQSLTEAARAVPGTLVVASLPASDIEVGGEAGRQALARLAHTFARVESVWRPASAEEGFEIVRRRLFQPIADPSLFPARDAVIRAYIEHYRSHPTEFPSECREQDYERRMQAAYPIHPELFDRLYEDWSSLERFQRTRGVLRLMAKVIRALWERGDKNPLILPATLPLDDPDVQSELTRYLDDNWVPVIEQDVDGPNALPLEIDRENPHLGRYSAARRVARTIYLGSAPLAGAAHRGLDERHVKLGCVQPGESVATFGDALRRLTDQATFLYVDGSRYWYATQPNVTRLAQDRAAQQSQDAVLEEIARRLRTEQASRGDFSRVHAAPATSGDVPDEPDARLVILDPAHPHVARTDDSPARCFAAEVLDQRGGSPRRYRNALVFLAPDKARLAELEEAVRLYLAWKSIEEEQEALNLDAFQRNQARSKRADADQTVARRIPEAYSWLLVPVQPSPTGPVDWDEIKIQGEDRLAVKASRKLRTEEQLIPELGGPRLQLELEKIPLWRGEAKEQVAVRQLMEDFAQYVYLPRLKDSDVLLNAIRDGVGRLTWQDKGFAYADAWDADRQRYVGLTVGERPVVSPSGLVVRSDAALRQLEAERLERERELERRGEELPPATTRGIENGRGEYQPGTDVGTTAVVEPPARTLRRFHGAVALDPLRVTHDAGRVAEAVIQHLQGLIGARVRVTLEIEAELPEGVPDHVVRTVSENARTLKFETHGFEEE
ncbi:MAG: Swt1 family HEPN domain-containing protein [Sphaerobacter sp.]|nr:Swt1 family HEPN domain-containing protein [Sphaerobacter sp.]